MIRGHSTNGFYQESIAFFLHMLRKGIKPNHLTFPFVLKACGALMGEKLGKMVHAHTEKSGFWCDSYVQKSLLDLYAKLGLFEQARQVFDTIPARDIVAHTCMVSAYNKVSDISSARLVFDSVSEKDIVLWTAMIVGYSQNGAPDEALALFRSMKSTSVKPNYVTLASVISCCAQLGEFEEARMLHESMEVDERANPIVCTALLDMYAKGGYVKDALDLFNKMSQKDVVSWNALITGLSKSGYGTEALELFWRIRDSNLEPDEVTLLGALASCSQLGALSMGVEINKLAQDMCLDSDPTVGTAILDMYAKCGNIHEARRVFEGLHRRDVIAWSAMINAYAIHGEWKEAISLFSSMLREGLRPNFVTFVGILVACSHGGLVPEGYDYFNSMREVYGVEPRMEHYACMVDLLGRKGRLQEAREFIDSMPFEPGPTIWGSLLGACAKHGNARMAEHPARHLFELEPDDNGNYVTLSNIYANSSRWEEVMSTRNKEREQGEHKTPGYSWIEVGGVIYEFLVGDRSHPQSHEIYSVLGGLAVNMGLGVLT
ncbi:pentatricopeptide repeat-containing protein At1g08070, chloroplastic-like [Amborella trichopoda]|uniref:pentatricopeptide repeat-containing protein At1g08070, chloroplastic-like n=1 Tax=Amborella trichopoda TaxID=13333 RepID=UPI0005D3F6CD|nr:pentatricopeptide repeat-containing protein At1g08070, chloroplastic-like [Amborella trichopoda]|eukprot:XP_011624979.1 pentatricopeptide repeat-containing protein At1g08070, chloroplastic-like [Amborella trichopoda]